MKIDLEAEEERLSKQKQNAGILGATSILRERIKLQRELASGVDLDSPERRQKIDEKLRDMREKERVGRELHSKEAMKRHEDRKILVHGEYIMIYIYISLESLTLTLTLCLTLNLCLTLTVSLIESKGKSQPAGSERKIIR